MKLIIATLVAAFAFLGLPAADGSSDRKKCADLFGRFTPLLGFCVDQREALATEGAQQLMAAEARLIHDDDRDRILLLCRDEQSDNLHQQADCLDREREARDHLAAIENSIMAKYPKVFRECTASQSSFRAANACINHFLAHTGGK